jgi:hypothetical protein
MKYEDVELEVTISENGEVQIEVKGVEGKRCLLITKELEELLGGELVGERVMKETRAISSKSKGIIKT